MKELVKIQTNADGKKAVSAKEMYLGVGLNPTQWQRWANKNIEKNPFATEGIDWGLLDIVSSESNVCSSLRGTKRGNKSKDYVLTLDFAKKLCMQARTQRGEDLRNYFLEVEKEVQNNNTVFISKMTEIAHDKQAVRELTEQKNTLNKRLRFLRMRIEDNENAVYAPYRANFPKQIKQPQQQNYQMELGFNYVVEM